MKGIILAGGSGTRLHPITRSVSKQLLPVYDKPMVYYPLSVLMLAGVREILIITTPTTCRSSSGCSGTAPSSASRCPTRPSRSPTAWPRRSSSAADHVGDDTAALVLGDNIFHGHDLAEMLQREVANLDGCTLFGYQVRDPERYGVAEADPTAG